MKVTVFQAALAAIGVTTDYYHDETQYNLCFSLLGVKFSLK
jgi:hypothetical protein